MSDVRVRFCPSPSGDLHVGNVRTALFNWAYARHTGGTFVFRIEDTDTARVTPEGVRAAIDTLRWLGLDWDEGPEVGGPYPPYFQSEARPYFDEAVARLLEQRSAYRCYCTPEEVQARNAAAGRPPGYDGHCRELTAVQVSAYEAEGRRPVVRLRMPEGSTTFRDLVRGEVTFDHEHVPDFTLTRADGGPLYTLANPVDDLRQRITHVVRGEDLLSSTPRQIQLYRALGVAAADLPSYAHLPFVMGEGNAKLSKRNKESSTLYYRREGYLPEALVNYLALLGWSIGEDRDLFTLDEMAGAFDLADVSRNPARFDHRKLEAINGDKIRELPTGDLRGRVLPLLQQAAVVSDPPTPAQEAVLDAAVPLARTRMRRLTEAVDLLRPLLVEQVVPDEADAATALVPESAPVLAGAFDDLAALPEWDAASVEGALRGLLERLGLKTKAGFPPLYVALTGRRTGLPLFDLVTLLGRETVTARLRAALDRLG